MNLYYVCVNLTEYSYNHAVLREALHCCCDDQYVHTLYMCACWRVWDCVVFQSRCL